MRGFVLTLNGNSRHCSLGKYLVQSVRKFGGKLKDAPIFIVDVGLSEQQKTVFENLGCRVRIMPGYHRLILPMQYSHEQEVCDIMAGMINAFELYIDYTLFVLGSDCLVLGDLSKTFDLAEESEHGICTGENFVEGANSLGALSIYYRDDRDSISPDLSQKYLGCDVRGFSSLNTGSMCFTNEFAKKNRCRIREIFDICRNLDWLKEVRVFGMEQFALSVLAGERGIDVPRTGVEDNCIRLAAHRYGLDHKMGTDECYIQGKRVNLLHLSGPVKPWNAGANVVPITQAYIDIANRL